jgi:hypothetical protein
MPPGRTSGVPSPLSGAEGTALRDEFGKIESEALGMSGSDPHDVRERTVAIRRTLSSFTIPFIAETNSSRGVAIQAGP